MAVLLLNLEVKIMRFLKSKKGFTLTELIVVVAVMAVLVVVAVPTYNAVSKTRRIDDCLGNRIMIENILQEAMFGMRDNGKKQTEINMAFANPLHVAKSPINFPEGYANVDCFILTKDESTAFTLGDIRGGYRSEGTYEQGCESKHYLKRRDLASVKFYTYLANSEIPQCAFEEPNGKEYTYYIFSDGTVLCDCPECLDALKN